MENRISKRQAIRFIGSALILAAFFFTASCASLDTWGTTDPPIVRVNVVNPLSTTSIGLPTTVYFSVVNVTDEALTDLNLDVSLNPINGVDVPFRSVVIDRIEPRGSWKPDVRFDVRGRRPGTTAIYFVVTKEGRFLAKNYCLISVPPGD
jgi:hypothetical protein